MKIRFLGTGAGYPDPQRMSSSVLMEGSKGGLLFDIGEGCARRLREPNRWAQPVSSVVITHGHADHVAGLPMLVNGWKGDKRSQRVELLAPRGLAGSITAWLSALRMGPERLSFNLTLREVREGEILLASGHRIELWPNDHLADEATSGGSFSAAITFPDGRRWIHSGDVGSLKPLQGKLAGAQGLIAETRHIEPEAIVALAREEGVERVILTHVPHEREPVDLPGATWAEDNLLIDSDEELASHE